MKHLRAICVVLCTVIVFCSLCISCSSNGDDVQIYPAGPYFDSDTVDITYSVSDGSGSNRVVAFGNNIIASIFVNWTVTEEQAEQQWSASSAYNTQGMPTDEQGNVCVSDKFLLLYNYVGDLIADVNLNALFGDFYDVPQMCIDSNDNVHVLLTMVSTDTVEYTYYHLIFDSNGELVSNTPLFFDQYYYVLNIGINDGSLIILGNDDNQKQYVISFSEQGTIDTSMSDFQGFLNCLYQIGDTVYAGITYSNPDDNSSVSAIASIANINNSDTASYTNIPNRETLYSGCLSGLIYTDEAKENVYLMNPDSGEVELLVSVKDLDLGIYMSYLTLRQNGDIAIIGTGYLDLSYGLATVFSCETDVNAAKTQLLVAGIGIADDPIVLQMKFLFDNSHDDYRLKLVDYRDIYGWEYSESELCQMVVEDLLFGNLEGDTPDIIIDPDGVFPFCSVSDDSYLCNLTDSYSYDLCNSDIDTNIIANSMIDGCLYSIPLGYTVSGFLTYSNRISQCSSWSISDFNEIAENYDGEMFSNMTSDALLSLQLQVSFEDYFDINSNSVYFDSESFIELLEWSKMYGSDTVELSDPSYAYYIQDQMHYSQYIDHVNIQSLFTISQALGESVCVAGVPSASGSNLAAFPEYRIAVLAAGSNYDASWDFVLTGFDMTVQNALSRVVFPLNNEALDYGIQYTRDYYLPEDPYVDGDITISSTDEMLERINRVQQSDPAVMAVVREEAAAYFAGEKSAQEVCELIQSRCEIIMSERYE